MEHIDYRVLAPASVAWHIQAALVADRTGNVAARDLALAEAWRVAAERRPVEQPAPDSRQVQTYDVAHECNGVRLMGIERRQDMQATLINELILRLAALEYTVRALQRLAQNVHGPEAGL